DLTLHRLDVDKWLVQTPIEFGAKNWVVWIGFSNSVVRSIKIRLNDSENLRPLEAPLDRESEKSD
ncbi:MAG: hypothetical protein L0Y56_04960, partial [Nitrospira sp.]|nr:hypothetical protein [Nitrospira sp.]